LVFAKITGIIIIILGIIIGLIHFTIIPPTFLNPDVAMIGILIFIAHEAYALIRNLFSDGNKVVSVGVPLLFMAVAGSFFIKAYIPDTLSSNLTLIIPVLMVAEGLYRLH
jgi:hypothetical protein